MNFAVFCRGIYSFRRTVMYGFECKLCESKSITENFHTQFDCAVLQFTSFFVIQKRGYSFDEAFGQILGTLMVVGLVQVFFAFIPYRYMHRMFPPMVIGYILNLLENKLMLNLKCEVNSGNNPNPAF